MISIRLQTEFSKDQTVRLQDGRKAIIKDVKISRGIEEYSIITEDKESLEVCGISLKSISEVG